MSHPDTPARPPIRTTGGIVHEPITRAICVPDCDWLTTRQHHPDCETAGPEPGRG